MPEKEDKLSGSRLTIGFLASDVLYDPGFDLWAGVADAAQEHNINLLCFLGRELHSLHGFHAQANVIYDLINADNVDGLILWGGSLSNFVDFETFRTFYTRFHPLPMINVASPLEDIPSVSTDNYKGMREAVSHLVGEHGYRRIVFIAAPEGNREGDDRYRAYRDVLQEHAIPFDPLFVLLGDFQQLSGKDAIRLLLDKRKLLPRSDFDAVIAANDLMALGALEEFQRRGIHVPNDVALAGFDDETDSRYVTPPLTTIPLHNYEQGRRAIEELLALLRGEDVAQQVVIPATLVVRQSCGCLDTAVIQAAAGSVKASHQTFQTAFQAQREELVAEISQLVKERGLTVEPDWIERLLDGFFTDLERTPKGIFLSALDTVLRRVMSRNGEINAWQNVISALRRHMLPYLGHEEALFRAEDLWQQARVMIGSTIHRLQAYHAYQNEQRARMLREIGAELLSTFDVMQLMEVLAEGLPRLGIPACYLSLYENPQPYEYPQPAPEWARLVLAYTEEGRISVSSEGERFPARDLIPKNMLPGDRAYSMVVIPLYFQQEQLGFALFETGPRDKTTYEALRVEISSALQGALLIRKHKRAEETIRKLNEELEDRVRDRTSELAQSNQALRESLNSLKIAQTQLAESERMASLGELVAGIAHEISTPVGVGVTAASHLELQTRMLEQRFQEQKMARSDLEKYLKTTREASQSILRNLQQASDHIQSFKRVAVDRTSEQQRRFNLKEYIDDVLISLHPKLKRTKHRVTVNCPENLEITSYPGIFSQIINNLVFNSLIHGFGQQEQGEILITVMIRDETLVFQYQDNGKGMTAEEVQKVFEPFFTTKREHGGSGLGMYIVHSLVTQRLNGTITCESTPGQGVTITIILPVAEPSCQE